MRSQGSLFVVVGCVAASLAGGAGCARRETSSATLATASSAVVEAGAPDAPDAAVAAVSPIPKELVDRVLNPTHLPAYDGPTGSVEGTILVTGPASPDTPVNTVQCPAALDTYGKLFREGVPAVPDGPRPLADAVVIAIGYGGYYLPEKSTTESVEINTRCGYPTRTIAMTFGQRLEVTNASKYPFAPMIDSASSPAVMMTAPLKAGDPIHLYPSLPGHSTLTDLMQPFVKEDVYVLRHPLHAVSGLDGHYRIDGVPVGMMSVAAQHPGVKNQAQAPVTIEAGVVQKVDLTIEYAPKGPAKLDEKRDLILR